MSGWRRIARAACLAGATACWLAAPTHSMHSRAQRPDNRTVDAIFADLDRSGSPVCALGVYRDGTVIYGKGYGLANLENDVPITPQTVFDVASIAKQFTATSILLIEQQGCCPVWSPEGTRIALAAVRDSPPNLYVTRPGVPAADERLLS